VERTPTFLAALASAAVPGLDPVSVEALPSVPDQDYDVAFVQDSEHRRWVVRAPRSEAAGARMDLTVPLLQMLGRRLPFPIPAPKGFVELKGGGRAMIYAFLPGQNLAFDEMPPGPGPAAELGRALAALHNTDVRLFDEAGMPTYDTDSYRRRRLTDLDRAAESGHVPTALLARWEHALEDVALWRFAPTCVHGDLTGDQVLAVFEDDSDASTGRIRGFTGWEDAKVADPADDFAALVDEADPATLETVLEAYAHARVERPDGNLLVRARLAAELGVLAELMRADSRGDHAAVEGFSSRLRRLDDEVHAEDADDDYRRSSLTPVALRGRATPPPVVDDDDDDEDVEFAPVVAGAAEDSNDTEATGPDSGRVGGSDPDEPDDSEAADASDASDASDDEAPTTEGEPADGSDESAPVEAHADLASADDTVPKPEAHAQDVGATPEPGPQWRESDEEHDDEMAWTPRTFDRSGPSPVEADAPVSPTAPPTAER
jgi:aminoglycoside phosphotransferase (APT) family kinase protein